MTFSSACRLFFDLAYCLVLAYVLLDIYVSPVRMLQAYYSFLFVLVLTRFLSTASSLYGRLSVSYGHEK